MFRAVIVELKALDPLLMGKDEETTVGMEKLEALQDDDVGYAPVTMCSGLRSRIDTFNTPILSRRNEEDRSLARPRLRKNRVR